MVNKISKKRNSKKSKKNMLGGKPILRNIAERHNSTSTTIYHIFQRITNIELFNPENSLSGYFFKIDFQPTDRYLNINTEIQDTRVNSIGYKLNVISTQMFDYDNNSTHKRTCVIADFHQEVVAQYSVFSNSYRMGANNLTPSIVHTHILDNNESIRHLTALNSYVQQEAAGYISYLIDMLRVNNTLRIAGIFMELFEEARPIASRIHDAGQIGKIYCHNLMRWALLRSAMVSGYLHADFHKDNMLYNGRFGFFRDNNGGNDTNYPETIQLIDWGRCFQNIEISDEIKQLFRDIRNYFRHNPNFMTQLDNIQHYRDINARIIDIFRRWIALGVYRGFGLSHETYAWVLSTSGEDALNSQLITQFEKRYVLNRLRVQANPNLFANTIPAPDRGILNSISFIR